MAALKADLLGLDARISEVARGEPGRPLLASHPIYQYFARRYGLNLKSVMWEPVEVPSEGQWAKLKGMLSEHPATWMLWEDEPAQESVERLRAFGVESVVVSPCANRPATRDFLRVMAGNAEHLEQVFRQR